MKNNERLSTKDLFRKTSSVLRSKTADKLTTPLSELIDIATKLLLTNDTDLDLINDLANIAGTPDNISTWLVNHHFNYAYGKQGTIPIYVLYDRNQFKIKS